MERRPVYAVIAVVCIVVIGFIVILFNSRTTIVLVRHAERASADTNTNLSGAGLTRAQELVAALEDAPVTAIYTTEFCRTSQTAQPLADQLGLSLRVQENSIAGDQLSDSACDPNIDVPVEILPASIDTTAELVNEFLAKNRGKVVLVVGHSDSVPQIMEELGVAPLCPDYFPAGPGGACRIPDDQFDNIFVVTVSRFFGNSWVIKARYGE